MFRSDKGLRPAQDVGVQVSRDNDDLTLERIQERHDVGVSSAGAPNIIPQIPVALNSLLTNICSPCAHAAAQWQRGLHRLVALLCVLLN